MCRSGICCARLTGLSNSTGCGSNWLRSTARWGGPSIDPELLTRMLIVGYCFGIRSEQRLCDEVHLNLAYRWFCRLGLDGEVPDHARTAESAAENRVLPRRIPRPRPSPRHRTRRPQDSTATTPAADRAPWPFALRHRLEKLQSTQPLPHRPSHRKPPPIGDSCYVLSAPMGILHKHPIQAITLHKCEVWVDFNQLRNENVGRDVDP